MASVFAWLPLVTVRKASELRPSAPLFGAAGADFAICLDNSAQLAWDYVRSATPIPWLHIAGTSHGRRTTA
jgi:aspartate/glutamate racemase